MFLQVADTSSQGKAASWLGIKGFTLSDAVKLGINAVLPIETFKSAWDSNPTVPAALAEAMGNTSAGIETSLRLAGLNPGRYFAMLAEQLGDSVSQAGEDDINEALAAAEAGAQDNTANLWLFAGLGLLFFLGLSSERSYRRVGRRLGMRRGAYHRARWDNRIGGWRRRMSRRMRRR